MQLGPPPSGICRAEAVNLSDPNADPSNTDSPDTDPHSHPHARHLGTHGHRPEPTQAQDTYLLQLWRTRPPLVYLHETSEAEDRAEMDLKSLVAEAMAVAMD